MENEIREEYFIKASQMQALHEMQRLCILNKNMICQFCREEMKLTISK